MGDGYNDTGSSGKWKKDVYITEDHIHPYGGEVWVPVPCNTAVSPTTGATADTFGSWVQLMASTPSNQFIDFHRAVLVNPLVNPMPGDGVYHVEIGVGASGAEVRISEFRFYIDTVSGNNLPRHPLEIMSPRIAPGSRVAVRVKRSVAGAAAVDLQFGYHAYPVGL